jgi:hypothetical protein
MTTQLGPKTVSERISAALRLEPMSAAQLASCLTLPLAMVVEELEIMQARATARFLPSAHAWINHRSKAV